MVAKPDAKVIFLRQLKSGIPDFNKYAVQLRARGCVVDVGDELIAYRVDSTVPEGPVLVTDGTKFVFSS